jgi:hypothetical protein
MSLSWRLYRSVAPMLGALAPWTRLLASPGERQLWNERLGDVVVPGGCHAWIHAASLGEAVAVGPARARARGAAAARAHVPDRDDAHRAASGCAGSACPPRSRRSTRRRR